MQKGIIDRFRSLPMARSAVLAGRTASDIVTNAVSITVMSITGLIVGWRVHSSVPEALGGLLLLLVFAYAVSWIMAFVGLKVASVEVVNNAAFMFIFPLTFVADTFVPSRNLPGVLQTFAEWNPVSTLAHAARGLFGNSVPFTEESTAWSFQHPVIYTLLWVALILLVFVPLSVRQYQRAATK
jgi:ABC-type multidrug transport system permease subunit